jgi:Na+/melibiose symporter-like transporter
MTGGRTIAAQYESSTSQKRQYFGRVDPFCLFAVVPIVVIAVLCFWSDIAIVGVFLMVVAVLIVVFDSWANRPLKKAPPGDDY